ncbi:MAG: hypothetical protein EPO26_02965 [Chloroflexota bacterium]|nr:MAG: hypothetical protein EPO26_02965 [Chloroflexota bacterium]
MSAWRPRQILCASAIVGLLVAGCGEGGEPRSFVSNKIEAVPTNVSGTGNTSGISAGMAVSVGGAGTPTPTPTPTATPTTGG